MRSAKHSLIALGSTLALACLPVVPAAAHGGPHFPHPWGLGRGLVGAVAAAVTLPLAIASAALDFEPRGYAYEGPPAGYYPPPAYYSAPRYYAPPAYYAAPRYYAPAPYYARRAYPAGAYGYHPSYGGNPNFRGYGPGYRR